uniref:transcription factor-like 5 protein isoform X2 n=1 Tax=Scatophagus argus TaxID=75038 RepID=UPI001ED83E7B|nr:transcription factor-like 5 protein isoform X2 [Scatophagus argus]
MSGTELGLMDMSEVEYTHFQHLHQAEPPDGPFAKSHPATAMVKDATATPPQTSAFTSTQAIDLSASTDENCLVMSGEKTPASYGEVPGYVLARVRGEDCPTEPRTNSSTSSQERSRSAARVCLEKRFKTMYAESPRQQDIHFLTILQQPAETQEESIHPEMQKSANSVEVSSPFVGAVFNPATSMCEQVIGHIPVVVEPKHQGLIFPKTFSFHFHPERVVSAEKQQLVNMRTLTTCADASRKYDRTHSFQPIKTVKAAPHSAGESGSSAGKKAQSRMSHSQRRERHNSKERERRKRIRLCCDELKMLVPFCGSDSDKVTTLQWTTAFLRYINKTYGDTFREEFERAFTKEKGLFFRLEDRDAQDSALGTPLVIEQ